VTAETIRIGTRGSALAMVQARLVAEALALQGGTTRLVRVETEGDRRAPDTAWGEGAFVKAIEHALVERRIDVAVHSAKDIPTDEDPRLSIGAYLARGDARDALVVRAARDTSLEDLPRGSIVGTDSPRRTAFLLARHPHLRVRPLHGNVDTRLQRLDAGEADALVLACAGLDRLGRADRIRERIDTERMPPAPGQGALALQIRRDDAPMVALTTLLDDQPTRIAVEAERELLRAAGGGCRAPVGAYGVVVGKQLSLIAGHAEPDGTGLRVARRTGTVDEASAVAIDLYRDLWATEPTFEAAR
jgi:hydroxymethylbilane synthase